MGEKTRMGSPIAASRLRIGVVTAFPPGRNSLNEYGFHWCATCRDWKR